MSSVRRHLRDDTADVIILDSDDETPAYKQSEAGPSSRQGTTAAVKSAGSKRNRNGDASSSRRRSLSTNASADTDVVDLTTARNIAPAPTAARSTDDNCIVGFDGSPAAKRRNIVVAKALAAHRKVGQQIVANVHSTRQGSEPREVDSKPKCGICLDEMKEPACGSCGHVFCKPCLLSCLKATKKCPTCRKTLQPRTVHRIYLS